MNCDIFELFSIRHSFYEINNISSISNAQVIELIKRALSLYPSPFNSQSARVVVLFNEENKEFWKIVEDILYQNAPKEKIPSIHQKITSFADGVGSILFFVDTNIVKKQEQDFPLYSTHFKNWSYQCNAILQFMIWSALSNQQIGASLQHYNPIIDKNVKDTFNIPDNWELVAQMPFGGITNIPLSHEVSDIDSKILILE